MSCRQTHPHRATEIVHDEADVSQIQRQDKFLNVVDLILPARMFDLAGQRFFPNPIWSGTTTRFDWLNFLMRARKRKPPRWLSVQAKHDFAIPRTFINVVHSKAACVVEVGRKWKGAVEGFRCQNHRSRPSSRARAMVLL